MQTVSPRGAPTFTLPDHSPPPLPAPPNRPRRARHHHPAPLPAPHPTLHIQPHAIPHGAPYRTVGPAPQPGHCRQPLPPTSVAPAPARHPRHPARAQLAPPAAPATTAPPPTPADLAAPPTPHLAPRPIRADYFPDPGPARCTVRCPRPARNLPHAISLPATPTGLAGRPTSRVRGQRPPTKPDSDADGGNGPSFLLSLSLSLSLRLTLLLSLGAGVLTGPGEARIPSRVLMCSPRLPPVRFSLHPSISACSYYACAT